MMAMKAAHWIGGVGAAVTAAVVSFWLTQGPPYAVGGAHGRSAKSPPRAVSDSHGGADILTGGVSSEHDAPAPDDVEQRLAAMRIVLTELGPRKHAMVQGWLQDRSSGYPDLADALLEVVHGLEPVGREVPLDVVMGTVRRIVGKPPALPPYSRSLVERAYVEAWKERNTDVPGWPALTLDRIAPRVSAATRQDRGGSQPAIRFLRPANGAQVGLFADVAFESHRAIPDGYRATLFVRDPLGQYWSWGAPASALPTRVQFGVAADRGRDFQIVVLVTNVDVPPGQPGQTLPPGLWHASINVRRS